MKQNSMLAMILAGGRGSRLHDLTNKVAKPAVSYGGKYRIIDFPLSNCANSGIDVVGVLTQYESVELNSYVAAGGRWGLDSKDSGDEDALYEVMGDDAAVTVTLDSDTANKLSIKVLQKYLGILGNGAVSYQEDGTEKYITPELNMLDKEMKKLFGIDVIDDGESSEDIDVLGDAVSSDDKDTLYKDTMKFFEKLYGESSDSSDSADGSENVTTDESATDEVGDESYDETIDEESYEE